MSRRRRSNASGIFTVLVLVGAAVLLIVVGHLLVGLGRRRAPAEMPIGKMDTRSSEIDEADRQRLQRILEEAAPR
jgi:hypothetical protein